MHRMKTGRRRLSEMMLALTIIFLSACASAPTTLVTPLTVPATNASLTITFWHTETDVAATTLNALTNDFHKAYPNITVRGEQKANEGDLLRQGVAAIAMNQTPDFIIADSHTIAEFARKGALVNLDTLATDAQQGLSDAERNDFMPGLLDAGRLPDVNNQWFAFPFDQSAVVLYYNIDMIKAAKADAPPRTWDQFGNAARATTRGNAHGWAMSPSAMVFYAFLFSRGGNVLATHDSQTQAQFGDDAGLNSLQLIAQLNKGGAAYLADSARNDFSQGRSALLFDTTDNLPTIADAISRAVNFQWGVTNIPQNDPSKPSTVVFGADIAIFKPALNGANGNANERIRATWLFARWLTLPEQSARWSRATFSIPVRVSALGLLANTQSVPPNFQRLRDGWSGVLPTGYPMPAVKDAGLIDAAMVEMWTNVVNGTDPAAALKNATTRVNRLLGLVQ
jgi:ABC-type glycerol-3-phosphate transport system substrate-binding protein